MTEVTRRKTISDDEITKEILDKIMNKMFDYEWEDNGNCIKAVDQYGNPKQPTDSDNLVKAS